jgi:D-aminopeptidase
MKRLFIQLKFFLDSIFTKPEDPMPESKQSRDSGAKYKMFRNYMTSELGITRQDIQAWVDRSVRDEVVKKINGIDLESIVTREAKRLAVEAVNGSSWGAAGKALRDKVAVAVAEKIKLNINIETDETTLL